MFNDQPGQNQAVIVTKGQADPAAKKKGINIALLTDGELLELKTEIDKMLGANSLKDLDMEQELLQQYNLTKKFLSTVIDDHEVPANQKAQVINSCTSILKELTATQTNLYNAERLKKLESAVIQCLKLVPKEAQELFMQAYEDCIEQALSVNPQ